MKFLYLLIFLIVPIASSFCQISDNLYQTIRGTVLDEDTQSPLTGVHIVILSSKPQLGTVTDVRGEFKITQVPIGRQSLGFSYLGYEDKIIRNLLVISGKESVLEVSMSESVVQMQMVTITTESGNKSQPVNDMALVSSRSFSVEETKRFAAGIGDPSRLMTAYAGVVSNGGDDQNAIIIRGNSPSGLLWRLEGIEIPSPNHFSSEGASAGGISILSTNTLTKSDFYTGAFPAEFGNALSGVFDIKLRNGNNENKEFAFQASVLGLEAGLEGPLTKQRRASYNINYRYSTLGLFNTLGIQIVSKDDFTNYQDISFKVFLPTQKFGIFSIHGIGGLSENQFKPADGTRRSLFQSDMGAIGVNHLMRIKNKGYLKTFISTSGTRLQREDSYSDPANNFQNNEKKVKSYLRVGSKLRVKINANHVFESGAIYSKLAYNLEEHQFLIPDDKPIETIAKFKEQGNSSIIQSYVNWKYKMTESISLISGIHALYFDLSKKSEVEPRVALKWQFTTHQSIGVGFGMHSRIESLGYYFANVVINNRTVQPNKNLDLTKARHYVVSYDHGFGALWYAKIEAYYQRLYQVPVSTDSGNLFSTLLPEENYPIDSLANQGTGTNYGLELTLQRFFDRGFYLLFTTSIYSASYTAQDQEKRNSPYNSNFGINFLIGKEIKMGKRKQNMLGLNLRTTYGGNRRFIPIDLDASIRNQSEIRNLEHAYVSRFPDYYKMDLQVRYRINKPRVTHELGIEILNLTNHHNVAFRYYNNHTQSIEDDFHTGIIPGIGYRIEF